MCERPGRVPGDDRSRDGPRRENTLKRGSVRRRRQPTYVKMEAARRWSNKRAKVTTSRTLCALCAYIEYREDYIVNVSYVVRRVYTVTLGAEGC